MADNQPLPIPDETGPIFASLTERQRNYIRAQASDPFGTPTAWARAAGYSDHLDRAKVAGHTLRHNPKIEAAAREYARHLMHRDGPIIAVAGLMEIARDRTHPKQLQALDSLADRVGLSRRTEHHVNVQHSDESAEAKVERIKTMAALLGIDPARLLGVNSVSRETPMREVKQIEAVVEKPQPVPLDCSPTTFTDGDSAAGQSDA
jgi:phage terminase small subunit